VTHFKLDETIADESPDTPQECCSDPHHHSHKCG
jgi:hypothetical protein